MAYVRLQNNNGSSGCIPKVDNSSISGLFNNGDVCFADIIQAAIDNEQVTFTATVTSQEILDALTFSGFSGSGTQNDPFKIPSGFSYTNTNTARPGSPVAPVGTGDNTGDYFFQQYLDGHIVWKWDGNTWVLEKNLEYPLGDQTKTLYTRQTSTVPDSPSAPVVTGFNVGDAIIEQYDDGEVVWTYDGASWLLNYKYVNGKVPIKSVSSATYNATANDGTLIVEAGCNTVNLPTTGLTAGQVINVFENDNGAFVTVDGNGNNINGSATFVYTALYESHQFQWDGTEWYIIN